MMTKILLLIPIISVVVHGQQPGTPCKLKKGLNGICRPIIQCPSVIQDLHENGIWPDYCIEDEELPIVCCGGSQQPGIAPTPGTTSNPVTQTTTTRKPTTFKPVPGVVYEPGIISRQKCQQYSKWLLSPASTREKEWVAGNCGAKLATFIFGGTEAATKEFPHMAHLGFSDGTDVTWECGGSLISEKFVLTAAHCLRNNNGHNVSFVRLGLDDPASVRTYKVAKVYKHPGYRPDAQYHDIALLELDKLVRFSDYRRPACLQVNKNFAFKNGTATGWGATETNSLGSKKLLKVSLPFVRHSDCSKSYRVSPKLHRGLDDRTMICAGTRNMKQDTCQGDSGGPLQILLKTPDCMYSVVGITSFGIKCGLLPGVYTRVSAYIPWIESIVWPQKPVK